jgi:hypothetical protein
MSKTPEPKYGPIEQEIIRLGWEPTTHRLSTDWHCATQGGFSTPWRQTLENVLEDVKAMKSPSKS